jgi:hypothetical protein
VQRDRREVGDEEQRLDVVADEVVDLALACSLHIRSSRTHSGANDGASFWKNDFPAMPSG